MHSMSSVNLALFYPRWLPTSGTPRHFPMPNATLLSAPCETVPKSSHSGGQSAVPCVLNTVSTADDVLRICDISISVCESHFSFPGPNELMTFFLYTLKDDTVTAVPSPDAGRPATTISLSLRDFCLPQDRRSQWR